MSWQIPSIEQFEPRLLMSGSSDLEALLASAAMPEVGSGSTVTAAGDALSAHDAWVYRLTAGAGGQGGSVGSFDLSLASNPVDDYGNGLAGAQALAVRADGVTAIRGTINYATDADYLRFTAPMSGRVTVQMAPYGYNALVPSVSVMGAQGQALADQQLQAGQTASVQFTAVRGR